MTPKQQLFASWHHYFAPTNAMPLKFTGTASPADYWLYTDTGPSGSWQQLTWGQGGSPVVLIPAGQTSVNVKVKAFDDTIVERLYETLNITIVSATHQWSPYVNTSYAFDTGVLKFKIKDNDTLDLQKVVFQGILPGFKSDPDGLGNTILWDNSNSNVSHWWKGKLLDKNPSTGYVPAAYSSQNKLQTKAFWANTQIDPNIINNLYVYFEVDINGVRKSNDVKLVNSGGTLNMGSALAELAQTFATYFQGKKAVYDPGFTLTWKFYVGGDEEHRSAGVSESCLYVTYDNPQTGNLYHSVVDIGCRAANGVTGAQVVQGPNETLEQFEARKFQPIFDAIWGEFESDANGNINLYRVIIENGAVVPKKSGNELFYYGIVATAPSGWTPYWQTPSSPANQYTVARANTSIQGSIKLLQHRDGTCGDWADFFLDIVKAQGNNTAQHAWIRANNSDPFFISTLTVNTGLGKHHNQNPLERSWGDHVIVVYNDTFYDTSV